MLEKRTFSGGLDKDSDDRLISNGDYKNLKNGRANITGVIENIPSNIKIDFTLPAGDNKVIGSFDDVVNDLVYYFVYNSLNNDMVLEYDANTNTITQLISDAILQFSPDYLINHVDRIEDLLLWTDGNNPPREINIEKAKAGFYSPLTEQSISLIKYAPNCPPEVEYISDPLGGDVNNLKGSLYQFNYKWVYVDGEESAWSPTSIVPIPNSEWIYYPFADQPPGIDNAINVTYNSGSYLVSKIKFSIRKMDDSISPGLFYEFKTLSKQEEGILDDVDVLYKYSGVEQQKPVSELDSLRLHDYVPLTAETQEITDENRLLYGNVLEGYDNLDIDGSTEPFYIEEPPPLALSTTPWSSAEDAYVNMETFSQSPSGAWKSRTAPGAFGRGIYYTLDTYFTGTANVGDVVSIRIEVRCSEYGARFSPADSGSSPPQVRYLDTVSYEVQLGDNFGDIVNGLEAAVNTSTTLNPPTRTKNLNIDGSLFPVTAQFIYEEDIVLDMTSGGSNFSYSGSGPTLKYDYAHLPKTAHNIYVKLVPIGSGFRVEAWSRNWEFNALPVSDSGGGSYEVFFDTVRYSPSGTDFDSFDLSSTSGAVGIINTVWESVSSWHNTLINKLNAYVTITQPIKPTKTFKRNSKHKLGIVYYDIANRSSLVQTNDAFEFETVFFQNSSNNGQNGVKVNINHRPPFWADKWQIVYPGRASIDFFVQTEITGIAVGSNNEITASLSKLITYNDDIDGVISYSFVKGDRLRVIKNLAGSYVADTIDVEIVSYDSGAMTITFKSDANGYIMTNISFVELYRPIKQPGEFLFYEIGRCYPILSPRTSARQHGTYEETVQGFTDQNQTTTQPAIVHLYDAGDVYFKQRHFDVKTGTPSLQLVEEENYSDFYISKVWDKGRPNFEDKTFSQRQNETRIYYSQPKVEGSDFNGLSTVYGTSFKDYESSYGDIKRLYKQESNLLVFQELKVGQLLINESTLYSNDGTPTGTVGQQNTVLNDMNYYAGEYGIGNNAESFAVHGNRKYFIDAERGAVLRLGLEGITPISHIGMQNYFVSKMNTLLSANQNFNAFGGYDIHNDEYVLSFEEEITGKGPIPGETIVYSDPKKRWTHFYSFLPEYMASSMIRLVSFKNGEFYVHLIDSQSRNNFYGTQYNLELSFPSNQAPSAVKAYKGIFTESTDPFSLTATTPSGQQTELVKEDFEFREGVYYSVILRDLNTPNEALPLLNGDAMRDASMLVNLTSDSTSSQKVFAVGVRFDASMLTNK